MSSRRDATLRAFVILAPRQNDFFQGDRDAIASANLQRQLEELATSVGATISSSENLSAEPRGAYRRIGIRVRLTDKYETVVKLLATLETATPPLVTGDLHMQATVRQTAAPEPWQLETVLDVYGFRNGDAPASASPPGGSPPATAAAPAGPTLEPGPVTAASAP